jgi:hypothetical protein
MLFRDVLGLLAYEKLSGGNWKTDLPVPFTSAFLLAFTKGLR